MVEPKMVKIRCTLIINGGSLEVDIPSEEGIHPKEALTKFLGDESDDFIELTKTTGQTIYMKPKSISGFVLKK